MTILEALQSNPQAPHCSICNHNVNECHPAAVSVVCGKCSFIAAAKWADDLANASRIAQEAQTARKAKWGR